MESQLALLNLTKTLTFLLITLTISTLTTSADRYSSPSTSLSEWSSARATYYAPSDPRDSVGGACGYGDLVKRGYGMATVGLSTELFERGQICGGCFELRCVEDLRWCIPGTSIIVTVTNFCAPNYGLEVDGGGHCNPPNRHFVLPIEAFEKIAIWKASNMPVQYRRYHAHGKVTHSGSRRLSQCSHDAVSRTAKCPSSTVLWNLYALAIQILLGAKKVLITNVAGAGDITAVKVKGSRTGWLPMGRNWGQNWHISADLKNQPLSFEVTTSDGVTLTSYNVAPKDWNFENGGEVSTQVIDGDGNFNISGVDSLVKAVKLGDCGLSYAVVSIMGPQSSGLKQLKEFGWQNVLRSNLVHLSWIWRVPMDDTAFEKQSALFALAVSDIVLINMWCHDIGREQAANKPLLKTVFQVMMRLFSPRKTTLLFVIRDKTRTPLENLEPVLREDIQKIWDNVPKPQAHKETPLSEFFNVEVTALSSYEEKEELFKEQVASLRQRFFHSIAPGGLAGDRRGVVPASGFSFSAQHIWKVIKENRDLDLPAHKVMVATVRCEEIVNEKFFNLTENEEWCHLEEAVQSGPVSGFGKKLSSVLETCLSEYDSEAIFFDEGVRTSKREQLEAKVLHLVHPAYNSVLGHLRSRTLDSFKEAFDKALMGGEGFSVAARNCVQSCMSVFAEGCADSAIKQAAWDPSKVRDKLKRDIDAHIDSVRAEKLSELTTLYEGKLNKALLEPVEALLDAANKDTWPAIRNLLGRETQTAVSEFSNALSGFEMDKKTMDQMIFGIENYARSVVETKAREEAGRVLTNMKERFSTLFSHDSDSMPRVWTGKEDIRAITKTARSASLKLLSVMTALRLDEDADNIENILSVALVDPTTNKGGANKSITSFDPLASSTWEEVTFLAFGLDFLIIIYLMFTIEFSYFFG
ncbi:hypothetical protein GIB67_006051 [Kingdonia uniflora]|uniref:Expansin n=1 Tax=Kingdonia uniflora TaxID=39325 RepID=A0A7J7LPR3_9MAGN|nr:hypothetical protein GIB67_006051 [Kingdonia uniflora]